MRAAVAFLLLLVGLPAIASPDPGETPAARLPAGAFAYVETNNLAGAVEALLDSPLGRRAREHPAVREFWAAPQGRRLRALEAMVRNATGYDLRGALRAVAGRAAAAALYPRDGDRPALLVAARLEPEAAPKVRSLLAFAALASGSPPPLEEGRPPLFATGGALFGFVDGDLLVLGSDRARVLAARDGGGEPLATSSWFAAARAHVDGRPLAFALLDLAPFAHRLSAAARAEDVGQALILGAAPACLLTAPHAAFALSAEGGALDLSARIPVPAELPEPVAASFGGALAPLPFALPETTIALLRLRRDLGALWAHRDKLLSEAGVAQTIEFETNFGTLTAGMDFAGELLPSLDAELVFLATRARYPEGVPAPSVRLPRFALLVPMRGDAGLWRELRQAFLQTMSIVNIGAMQAKGHAFRLDRERHGDVEIETATYAPPGEGEADGGGGLPIRFNFQPACAMVGRYFALASHAGIIRELIDAGGGAGAAPAGVNAGLWIRGSEAARALAENREPLVAQAMLKQGKDRAAAEAQVDALLELARHLRAFDLAVEEGRAALGLRARLELGPRAE
jgi:hypothetical protein